MTAHNITDRGLAYNAASYERGVSDGNLPIVVDGQVLYILRNLHAFLEVLRINDFRDTPLFIDAMCIN
jgi:hypothetical protein